jgi:UDP-N-acetylmuramate dehydrogenase
MNAAANLAVDWSRQISHLGLLREYEPMARHTTLAVGGPARWFFRPRSSAALIAAMQVCPVDIPILPLGRGSNMLVADDGYFGLVIDFSELNAWHCDGCAVRAEAGMRMSRFARQCAGHGLSGCEFMATVPGDVGGGVAMNAGCFGQQVSDTLTHAEVLMRSGEVRNIRAAELEMGYRRTMLPEQSLILAACFELGADGPEQIRQRMRDMRRRRSSTQPLSQPNCGSVFKNPPGDFAARLVEAAGLKGMRIGGARISDQHANFIVNEHQASSADILALIKRAKSAVKAESGIELEAEVRLVGAWR